MRCHRHVVVTTLVILMLNAAAVAAEFVGKAFPVFDATDPISNKKFALADFKGKVVLVDFWATWCGPCVKELPNVKRAYEKFKDDGLEVISISLDNDAGKFKSFVGSNGMKWHHVMDGGGWGTRLAKKYGINSIPRMVLIDHEGKCIADGDSIRGEALAPAIEKALKKAKDAAPAEKTDSKKPEKSDAPRNTSMIDQWRQDFAAAKTSLETAQKPLTDLAGQVREARSAPGVEPSKVIALRRKAFMMGLINDAPVTLPGKQASANDAAKTTAAALDRLNQAAADAQRKFNDTATKLDSLQKQFDDPAFAPDKSKTQVEQALNDARGLAEKWSPAWKSQLQSLSAVVEGATDRDAQLLKRIDSAERALAEIRYRMAGGSAGERVRSDLASLRSEVDGIRSGIAGPAPSACDAMNNATAESADATIKAAGDCIVALRQAATKQQKSTQVVRDRFAGKVKQLQTDLASSPNDPKWLDSVEQRFIALCDELLASWDQR